MDNKFFVPKIAIAAVCFLSIAGFFVALYLAWLHYQVYTDPSFHSFCAMSDAFNCETVAESPYSVFLGLPVAVWGMLGYLGIFFLTAFGVARLKLAGAYLALLACSVFSVIASVILAVVSYCIICSFCVMCTVSYGINVLIFVILLWWAIRGRFSIVAGLGDLLGLVKKFWLLVLLLVVGVLVICLVFPKYWQEAGQAQGGQGSNSLRGVDSGGQAWIGADEPELVIEEFSDYLCPHCRRAHAFMRSLVAMNSDRLRLVHRHFPLDDACNALLEEPFHPGACLLAGSAICAKK